MIGTKTERVLLVVTPDVTLEDLEHEVPPRALKDTTLRIVVPSVARSALAYWFTDEGGIEDAREAADEARKTVGMEAAVATADAGDADPELAVHDAVAQFKPDRIIVVHRANGRGYRERKLLDLAERIHRPVEDHLIAA
jgi:hypothetical protein